MTQSVGTSIAVIIICGLCTFFLRAFPFVLFGGKREMPKGVKYLANTLPPAIMTVLLVYCLKGVAVQSFTSSIPALLSVAVVMAAHIWKKNTLLSILVGTILYMVLIRTIFK